MASQRGAGERLEQSEDAAGWWRPLLFGCGWSGALRLRDLHVQSPKQARGGNVLRKAEGRTVRDCALVDLLCLGCYVDTCFILEDINFWSHKCVAWQRCHSVKRKVRFLHSLLEFHTWCSSAMVEIHLFFKHKVKWCKTWPEFYKWHYRCICILQYCLHKSFIKALK